MIRGVGLGFRPKAFSNDVDRLSELVDFVEFNVSGPVGPGLLSLYEEVVKDLPCVVHSIGLSLGSDEPIDEGQIAAVRELADTVHPAWVSEHLSFSQVESTVLSSFIPLPYTHEQVDIVGSKVRQVQHMLGVPILFENVTHRLTWPANQMSEAEFISAVVEKGDCNILLDVTNLYINASYFHYDPYEFLQSLPKERIKQLHIAGYSVDTAGILADTHIGGVTSEICNLIEWALRETDCRALVVERDNDIQSLDDVKDDITIVRDVFERCC